MKFYKRISINTKYFTINKVYPENYHPIDDISVRESVCLYPHRWEEVDSPFLETFKFGK